MRHVYQLASPVACFHLAVDQAWFHLPPAHGAPSPTYLEPLTKVGSERREGEIEPVTGEERQTAGSQELSQGVDSKCAACSVRGPRESTGRILVQGSMASHSQSTCVEQRNLVRISSNCRCGRCRLWKDRSWKSSACLPARVRKAGDGGLTGAEDPFGSRKIQPFGQRSEHHGDLVRGCFQTIQRCVAPGSERCMTGRASKGLDPFGLAMLAIPNQSVDLSLSDPEGGALLIGTGVALGLHALGGSPPAFHLSPRSRHLQALALHPTHAMRNEPT
jgi:hypothetical protein